MAPEVTDPASRAPGQARRSRGHAAHGPLRGAGQPAGLWRIHSGPGHCWV